MSMAIAVCELGNSTVLTDSVLMSREKFPEHEEMHKAIKSTHFVVIDLPDSQRQSSVDSAYKHIERFYADQFRQFQDPRAPYFMFLSKNAELAMGIGGVVRMRGWFDWNGSVPANGFAPYLIPMQKDPTSKLRLSGTPAGTAFFMTIFAHKPWLGYLTAHIQAGFSGYNNTDFKLKKAYVTINDLTIGYTTSTFCDPAALAPIIDAQGANGKIDRTNILVRYLHTFKNRWSLGGSLELPKSNIDATPGLTAPCSDYVPDICAMAQYQWDEGLSHIRLSGLLRVMAYRDLIAQRNRRVVGWGAMFSGMWKVVSPLTLYWSGAVGQGQSSYQAELSIGSYDLVGDSANPGLLYAPTSFGITAGLKYNFLSNLYVCGTFGFMRYCPKHHQNDDDYQQGLYGAASLFWDLTPRLQFGAEYLIGQRRNFNGKHASANRAELLFQFSF